MDDARDPKRPQSDPSMPLTRRELRRRREAAASMEAASTEAASTAPSSAESSGIEASITEAPGSERETESTAPPSLTPAPSSRPDAAPLPRDRPPATPRDRARPVSFGSVAGLFADTEAPISQQPTVLVVCTGNICRSPLAEVLLRTRLSDLDIRVHSAGTHGLIGHAMTDPAQQLALDHGAEPALAAAHRARLLTEPLLDDADLILTMTGEQREHAVQLLPRRLRRVFPIREFARLAQELTPAQVRSVADGAGTDPRRRLVTVVEAVAHRRGGTAPKHEDVIDPFRRSFSVYQESATQLSPALVEVERVIRTVLG